MGVIETWLADLRRVLKEEHVAVVDLRIGVFYTAARLSTGHVGTAFTPRELEEAVCCPRSTAAGPGAGQLAGQNAWALAGYVQSPVPIRRAVGVAVLNALSAMAMARHGVPGGQVLPGVDALKAAEVWPDDRVVMVGAFVPFLKVLKGQVASLWIVDKHRKALKPDELPYWKAPDQAAEAVAQASVLVVTGSALVEGGIDSLLDASRHARRVVLAGPTASSWPPPFFARGVHVLGGIRILDGPRLMQIVSEGGAGHSFESAAEKVCIVRDE